MGEPAFIASLHEVFERLGRIEARRMFGGHGIFHGDRMIALVAGDTLYLKSDGESAAHFDAAKLPPFTYSRAGKPTQLSYREAPAEMFEDRDVAATWSQRAWEAALRSGQPAKKKAKAVKTAKAVKAAKK